MRYQKLVFKILCLAVFFCIGTVSLQAQDGGKRPKLKDVNTNNPAGVSKKKKAELPDGNMVVTMGWATNYVVHGADFHDATYAQQKGKAPGAHTGVLTFQPSVLYVFPVKGLTLWMGGNFAMQGRDDVDTDQVVQTSPGGADVSSAFLADPHSYYTGLFGTSLTLANLNTLAGCLTATTPACAPGVYEEENGTRRKDEIVMVIDYGRLTKIGKYGWGIVNVYSPHSFSGSRYNVMEFYAYYALPFIPDLKFTVVSAVTSVFGYYQFYRLQYEKSFKITKAVSIKWDITAQYKVEENLQGLQHITNGVTVNFYGFYVGAYVANRPELAFVDDDTNTYVPLDLMGGSNKFDGKGPDYSRTLGIVNSAINSAIQTQINTALGTTNAYVYTPRAKIPKNIYWLTFGYSMNL